MTAFGIDSVHAMAIVKQLEQDIGQIPSYILIEYPTIESLSDYLISKHRERLEKIFQNRNWKSDGNPPAITEEQAGVAHLTQINPEDAADLLLHINQISSEEIDHLLNVI